MIFTTPTQYAVLAVCLLAGWLFGLASHPGGRKWKDRLRETEATNTAYRADVEARVKAAEERARLAEAERDRLAKAAPVTAQTIAPQTIAPQTVARPAHEL